MTDLMRLLKSRRGYAVLLGDSGHILAPYKGEGASMRLGRGDTIESAPLRELSGKGFSLSLCFSPRTIYSDIGEFSSVSPEATAAHIRSSLDKIGLFKDDYRISFIKLGDIDSLRGRYSYLAIPVSELSRIEFVDGDNAVVECFCPIEASLAATLGTVEKGMVVLLYEDTQFIRIIAAKGGIIYYLITINAAESFDPLSDTASGIREIMSLLINSYQEKVQTVHTIGQGEVSREDLQKIGIDAVPFPMDPFGDTGPEALVLFGTAMYPRYDFTPDKPRKTRALIGYAKTSIGLSLAMIAIAVVLLGLGLGSASKARDLRDQAETAARRDIQELRELQENYALLSKDLDLSNINAVVEAYKDFQAEPRLHAIIDTISREVPDAVFLTRIEVKRPAADQGSPSRVEPREGTAYRSTRVNSFAVVIEGVINKPYPRSKEVFSSFMTNMQGVYGVKSATYSHKELYAEFSLNCEMNL